MHACRKFKIFFFKGFYLYDNSIKKTELNYFYRLQLKILLEPFYTFMYISRRSRVLPTGLTLLTLTYFLNNEKVFAVNLFKAFVKSTIKSKYYVKVSRRSAEKNFRKLFR